MHLRMLSLCVPTLRSLWPIPTNSMCSFVIMSLLLKIGIKMTRKWWSLLYWNSFGRTSLLFILAPPAKSFHFNFSHSDRIMNELGSKQAYFVTFLFFTTTILHKNCRHQQDLNSDRHSRRRAHWPLHHQSGLRIGNLIAWFQHDLFFRKGCGIRTHANFSTKMKGNLVSPALGNLSLNAKVIFLNRC